MIEKPICLAGDGWGAISAYRSLSSLFQNIDLITSDAELVAEAENSASHKIIDDFVETEADTVICAGYKPIISLEELQTKNFINIHYSLLPKYRGLHSTVWAILNDEKELGLTIHCMNEFIDDGPIIFQHSVANDFKSTSAHYMKYFNKWIHENLAGVIANYLEGKISAELQDKNLATWVGRRGKNDCKIDFSKDHKYISNFFRALVSPYPLPYIELIKSKVEYSITKVSFIERRIHSHIGRILNIDKEGVYVSSKDGYVILKEILDQDGRMVDMNNFRIGNFLNQDFK